MTARRGPGRAVVLAAGLLVLGSGCSLSLQSMPKLGTQTGPSYQVHATFGNVLNLPANAQVREGSALIGQVGTIKAHDFQAEVVLKIRKDIRLPVGTTAQVRFDSPLGDEYVVVQTPPTANGPWLADGATLGESETSTAPSVEDTFAALGAVLNGGGINQLQTIISELNKTFNGNQPEIRTLLEQIAASTTSLAAHTDDIDGALAAMGNLSTQLNAGSLTITQGIDTIAPSVTVLATENQDLSQLLTQLTQLSTVADSVLNQTGQNMVNDVNQLLPVLNQLVGVEQQLGPDLADIARFETVTPKIAPGNYLQVSVTATAIFNSSPTDATAAARIVGTRGLPASTNGQAVTTLLEAGLP